MKQAELFDMHRVGSYSRLEPAAPFVTHSQTSFEAAKRIDSKVKPQMELVYDYIKSQGERGATRPEIAEATGIPDNSVRPRVNRLLGEDRRFVMSEDARIQRNGEKRGAYEVLEAI